jgi:hypothetical protein
MKIPRLLLVPLEVDTTTVGADGVTTITGYVEDYGVMMHFTQEELFLLIEATETAGLFGDTK